MPSIPQENRKTVVRNELANEPSHVDESLQGNGHSSNAQGKSTPISLEVQEQVRQLLAKGYRIGMEHANTRRFRSQSWQSCDPIQTTDASVAIAALEACLNEHNGEYVRLIGIDSKAKRRVAETIIQRPNS
jgi:carbon dioxide concentrating mechanism protein CcmM